LPHRIWEPLCGMRNTCSEMHAFTCNHVPMMHLIFKMLDCGPMKVEWRQCIIYVFFLLGAEHQLLRRYLSADEKVFAEEGFAQAVLSAFGYLAITKTSANDINRYVDDCPALKGVIFMDTSPEICLERLNKRPELPLILSGEYPAKRLDRLKYLDECLHIAADGFKRRNIPVWRFSDFGTQDVMSAARLWYSSVNSAPA